MVLRSAGLARALSAVSPERWARRPVSTKYALGDLTNFLSKLADHAGTICTRNVASSSAIYRFKVVWGMPDVLDRSAKLSKDPARPASRANKRGIWVSPSICAKSRTSRWRIAVIYEPNHSILRPLCFRPTASG